MYGSHGVQKCQGDQQGSPLSVERRRNSGQVIESVILKRRYKLSKYIAWGKDSSIQQATTNVRTVFEHTLLFSKFRVFVMSTVSLS